MSIDYQLTVAKERMQIPISCGDYVCYEDAIVKIKFADGATGFSVSELDSVIAALMVAKELWEGG